MVKETEPDFLVESPDDNIPITFSFEKFLYATLYEASKNISQAVSKNNSEFLLLAYSEAERINFALSVKCKNKKYFEYYSTEILPFFLRYNLVLNNSPSTKFFLVYMNKIHEWLNRMGRELRRLGYTPPNYMPVVAGGGAFENEKSAKMGEK